MQGKLRDIVELQRRGIRTCDNDMSRKGGAGPTDDSAIVFSDGITLMVPTLGEFVRDSEYVLENQNDQAVIKKNGKVVDIARKVSSPRFYELETKEGISYRKIARLHGSDCLATTVIQECVRYNNADTRCRFCAIGVSLQSGATIHTKTPAQLAEVAKAAKRLDGVSHVTLTTGTINLMDKGAVYVAECARAIKKATGLPIQAQVEPPVDCDIFFHMKKMGVDDVGIHIESFDPEVRSKVTPGKSTISIERYFEVFEKAVSVFGRNKVSTFVILGLGEDEELTLKMCRETVKMGVYPFLVPLRPVSNTPMADVQPPDGDYLYRMYVAVGKMLQGVQMSAEKSTAGCVKCKACSALQVAENSKCV